MTQVFLDANVYVAGFVSETGASAFVLELAQRGKIHLLANRWVLRETERNLRLKANPKILKSFRRFIRQTKIYPLDPPSEASLEKYEPFIHPKDVSVLAAALEAKADFLLTLDRRHFLTAQVLSLPGKTKILTPGEFVRESVRKGKL